VCDAERVRRASVLVRTWSGPFMTFKATRCLLRVSSASYTTAVPPLLISRSILYLPPFNSCPRWRVEGLYILELYFPKDPRQLPDRFNTASWQLPGRYGAQKSICRNLPDCWQQLAALMQLLQQQLGVPSSNAATGFEDGSCCSRLLGCLQLRLLLRLSLLAAAVAAKYR
jgi:hypothetical protein